MSFTFRLAGSSDLPRITDIYNQAIAMHSATADMTPVTVADRSGWLDQHPANKYPVYVALSGEDVVGYCSISAYRPGREALRYTAEISYYVDEAWRRKGVASGLIDYAIVQCESLDIKTLFAIILDVNEGSPALLAKFGFEEWGRLPGVADFDGSECGHLYYGKRIRP